MGNGPVQPPNWGFYCSTNWGKAKLSFACCSAILAIATLVNGWLKI